MPTSAHSILVVGGAGYIGSHMVLALSHAGYQPIVLDNLSTGHRDAVPEGVPFYHANMADAEMLSAVFAKHAISAVMHFAGYIEVGESVIDPLKYYVNNVAASLTLFQTMLKHHVFKIVFSSTAAVYGSPNTNLINELHPAAPINPYGKSKLMVENVLRDLAVSSSLRFAILRYFNAAGADPAGQLGERHLCESHLIPILLEVAAGKRDHITIYGTDYLTNDGTCIRDYVHVSDICEAHLLALDKLMENDETMTFNIGTGQGYSVLEVIAAVERVTGIAIKNVLGESRLGDPAVLVADSSLIRKTLAWVPQYTTVDAMIAHAWAYMHKSSVEQKVY